MTFAALTSMHGPLLAQFGQRMINSFDAHWPADVRLYVYGEDCAPVAPSARVIVLDLHETCPRLVEFKLRHCGERKANGLGGPKYSYRWDAVKFANKTFAVIHAATTLNVDRLIWIDADTVTHAPIPESVLTWLCPDECYIGWLHRDPRAIRGAYPECGFYCLNLRHPLHTAIMARWLALYTKDKVFRLPEQHDSYVLMRVIQEFPVAAHSISGAGDKTNHPLVNGPLGAYLDHMKSPKLKRLGYTPRCHLRKPRTEEYWTDRSKR